MQINRTAFIALLMVTFTSTQVHAGKLTCLTGTDPSVATDAQQLATIRGVMAAFECGCSVFDGSKGKRTADFAKCVKQHVDVFVQAGELRPQCKSTLLKQVKVTTCGANPSQNAALCVKKSASGKVTCAVKPSAQCVDKPGAFTQGACTGFPTNPYCVDAADTNNDGIVGVGDSGACAPLPVCGNGVRESYEQCDPPGASCPAGQQCLGCACFQGNSTPTNTVPVGIPTPTPTRTSPPGIATNTPTRTPANPPTATFTPTPVGSGCCANATGAGMCIDSSDNGYDSFLCSLSGGAWMPGQHCSCSSLSPCTGTCQPGAVDILVDNGDGTISDQTTGLMWEKKDQAGGLHDVNKPYTWAGRCADNSLCQPNVTASSVCAAATGGALGCAQCSSGTCNVDPINGGASTTIWDWLVQLNGSNFAGHSDWHIPTVGRDGGTAELGTIVDPYGGVPNVSAAFENNCTPGCAVSGCSCTASYYYWSATTYAANPQTAWYVLFDGGLVGVNVKPVNNYVRAVR